MLLFSGYYYPAEFYRSSTGGKSNAIALIFVYSDESSLTRRTVNV